MSESDDTMTSARQQPVVRTLGVAVFAGALLLAAWPAEAAPRTPEKARLETFADRTAYRPGSEALVAAVVVIDDHWHVNAHRPTYDYLIPTTLTVTPPSGWSEPSIEYPAAVRRTFAFAGEPLDVYEGKVVIRSRVPVPADAGEGRYPLAVRLRYQACDDDSCLPPVEAVSKVAIVVGEGGRAQHPEVFATTAGGAGAAGGGSSPTGAGPITGGRLALMLLLGVAGGLILHVMPCVLPVLSLKVFGLVKAAGLGRAQVVAGSLATTAGILASFWALALFAIVARSAGAAVGWGVQFQQPAFVTFLAVVVVLFSLNLWGLFEIPLPSRLLGTFGGGPREGLTGHFASGLFATLMATPCSAPFLGTALGFALAQSAPVIVAVFTAVGVGMALPYLLLAVAPGAARFLPRPGDWMEHVRKLMGFLLAAAAVWLFFVLAGQISPERLAAIELGLLAVALFVWLRGRVVVTGALRHAAAAGVVAATVLTLVVAGGAAAGGTARGGETQGLIAWEVFDQQRAEELATAGRLVFVDVTADWCFTCKTNERLVLETRDTAALFEEHGVVAMKADWTNQDPAIASFLADHGRYSIPFYLLYRPGSEPLPFGELLTRTALRRAVADAAAARTARLD
ncbi:MAG TPA: thioredoxin family protein [Thermoanaerobaculia bacterium]|nr:thioredoxin family protein [Thermoanaerobaculia bacterium]